MSYPAKINILIVEDESDVKEGYREVLFEDIEDGRCAEPSFAFCFDDAERALTSQTIYHLVVIDLRLPKAAGEPAPDHIDFGKAVIDLCARRCDYPVIAVLVISGHLTGSTQSELEELLQREFYYGRARVKSHEDEKAEFRKALAAATDYVNVGIVERDDARERSPGLSERERDLLRRTCLQCSCIGLDLGFWSASYAPGDAESPFTGWTKVYLGRFIDNNYDTSSICFFKFTPKGDGAVVSRDANSMQRVLPHIKVMSDPIASGTRYLICTQKVGAGAELPISLEEFLQLPTDLVRQQAAAITEGIASQLDRLGTLRQDMAPPRALLKMATASAGGKPMSGLARELMEKHGIGLAPDELNEPFRILDAMLKLESDIRMPLRTAHGDLNATNVALERIDHRHTAYIFDASGMSSQPVARDLANLEVTTLLHTLGPVHASLVAECSSLYGGGGAAESQLAKNCMTFIETIRAASASRCTSEVYAAMVFDIAFGQVWGLAYSGSANKVQVPADAVRLLLLASRWMAKQFHVTS